ncbi:MAG: MFS transporter [Chthonomonadaceae bacterium]|nr:MFS transporter [Chthonomonadaceae bacterium]
MRAPPALKHKQFVDYLLGSFVSNVGNNVQAWANAWHIYAITQSSFMVGLLGVVRVVPLLVFSLFGGVVADHYDRRKVLLATQAAMAIVSLGLTVLTFYQIASVAAVYVMVALNAVARAFDGPVRQSVQVGLVPLEDFPNAASLNGVTWRLSDVLGPVFAGLLIAVPHYGLMWCYALNFLSFFSLLAVVWRMPPIPLANSSDRPQSFREVIVQIKQGLKFVKTTPVVRHAMWIDFWATFWSGAEALIPAFAGKVLNLGPQGFGLLASSTGIGALLAAFGLSWFPTVRRQGRLVVLMIALFGFSTIGFGFAPNLPVACLCLAVVGASDMVSTVMRQTIRQLATPNEMRGRMNATSSLFHISGPQLGDSEAGLAAHFWGERASIKLGGAVCLFVALVWSRAKGLTEYEHPVSHDRPGQV